MSREQGIIEELCPTCGRGTAHEVVSGQWQMAAEERPGKGGYASVMTIRCRKCGAERELTHTGGWDQVVGYLLEKRLLRWPQTTGPRGQGHRPGGEMERESIAPNEEMLRAASAFVRNIYIQTLAEIEGGTTLSAATTLTAFLAAVCEDLEIQGRSLRDRVDRLVDLERNFLEPALLATACSLAHLAEMRVHWIVACSRSDLVDALRMVERLYLSQRSHHAHHGPS
jgi:hypothetical protein